MGDAFDDIINAANKYGTWEAISRDHMICALEDAEDKINRLRTALEQAERKLDEWKLKVCEWQDLHTEMEKQRDEARGLLREAKYEIGADPECGPDPETHQGALAERIDAHLRGEGD